MRLCSYTAIGETKEGSGITVGVGTGYQVNEGLHGITVVYTAGGADDGIMAIYLQHSPDGTNWADLITQRTLVTADSTTAGAVTTDKRNLLLTIADDTAVTVYAEAYIPVGYLRERIKWTSGTGAAAIYID